MTLPLAKKGGRTLVEVGYDDATLSTSPAPLPTTTLRYVDQATDYTDDIGTWTACPALNVALPDMGGLLDTQPAVLALPFSLHQFCARATSGEPFPRITVTVYQVVEAFAVDAAASGSTFTRYRMFTGYVSKRTRASGRRASLVKFEILQPKSWLNVPAGIAVAKTCQWTLGGFGCGVNFSAVNAASAGGPHGFLVQRSVVAIEGTKATLSGPLLNFIPAFGNIYVRGYLRRGDLRLGIRLWDAAVDADEVHLVKQAPSWWVGATIDVYPGCDKLYETCDVVYNNALHFMGLGRKVPNIHKVFEVEQ